MEKVSEWVEKVGRTGVWRTRKIDRSDFCWRSFFPLCLNRLPSEQRGAYAQFIGKNGRKQCANFVSDFVARLNG